MQTTAVLAPARTRSTRAARERRRVRAHIEAAERFAHARDLASMSPLRALVRTLLLEELARYRADGVFPHNADFRDERRPYFVDARGVRCAMAHLLEVGGEGALVARIASERNNAYVRELADEPRLLAWLEAAGLTVEEAATIQPGYSYLPTDCLCGGTFQSPPYLVSATAVLEVVTTAAPSGGRVAATVRAVRGGAAPVAVGDTVFVASAYDPALAIGTVFLAPIGGSRGSTPARDAGSDASADAGGADGGNPTPLTVNGVPLSPDGTYTCTSRGAATPPGLTVAQFVDAVQSDQATCQTKLRAIDSAWGSSATAGGCTVAPGTPGAPQAPPSSLGILAAVLGVLAARRVARSL